MIHRHRRCYWLFCRACCSTSSSLLHTHPSASAVSSSYTHSPYSVAPSLLVIPSSTGRGTATALVARATVTGRVPRATVSSLPHWPHRYLPTINALTIFHPPPPPTPMDKTGNSTVQTLVGLEALLQVRNVTEKRPTSIGTFKALASAQARVQMPLSMVDHALDHSPFLGSTTIAALKNATVF